MPWLLHSATTPACMGALACSMTRPSAKRGLRLAPSGAFAGVAEECAPLPHRRQRRPLTLTVSTALRSLCTVYLVKFSFCNDSAKCCAVEESQHSALVRERLLVGLSSLLSSLVLLALFSNLLHIPYIFGHVSACCYCFSFLPAPPCSLRMPLPNL